MKKIKVNINDLKLNGLKLKSVDDSDVIIKKSGEFNNEYVYDIEVEDGSHTFLADNILAHNSCVFSSIITTKNESIGNLFNRYYKFKIPETNENGHEILSVDNEYTYGLNGETKIKYVSRHCVSKDKWKITIDNNEVEMTADHSVMVYRNGEIIECKPEDIKETDYLLKRKN